MAFRCRYQRKFCEFKNATTTDRQGKQDHIHKSIYCNYKKIINSWYNEKSLMVYEDMMKEIYKQFHQDIKNIKF